MKIFENIFFKVFLVLFLLSVNSEAEKRIDLDLRLEPKKEKNYYLLKESFNNKKIIELGGMTTKLLDPKMNYLLMNTMIPYCILC